MNDNNNFEESMKDLELIVEKLEKGEQNLEKSLQLFEEGVEISKKLNDQLKNAEKHNNIQINYLLLNSKLMI